MPDDGRLLKTLANPFVDAARPTFADIMKLLSSDVELSASRRRDLVSSLRCLMRLLDLDPATQTANLAALRKWITELHPARAGISAKRLANIKADVSFAFRHLGLTKATATRKTPLASEWRALWSVIKIDQLRWKLSRLFHYCSALGVRPEEVTDEVIEQLHRALVEESFVKDPELTVRATIYAWNRAKDEVPGWPQLVLNRRSSGRKGWTFPLETFPKSLLREIDGWEAQISGKDLLADTGPLRPLSPRTIKHRVFQIRMFASALVHRGHPIENITSLAYLVEIEHFRNGLRFLLERGDGQPTEAIHGLAMGIKAIARHHVRVDADHLEKLRRICKKLDLEVEGVREKNRERLLQFEDPYNLAALLHLPEKLVHLASRKGLAPYKAALLVQMAVAVEILIHTAIRVGNLATLSMEKHIRWVGTGKGEVMHITIPQRQVKNRQPIHHEIADESADLVRLYIDKHHPFLTDEPSEWLFPGRCARPKIPSGLSQQITKVIRKHTGLTVNAHLFRHLVAKMHLSVDPGDMVTVSRVLNDTLEMTVETYARYETRSQLQHYQQTVRTLRERLLPVGKVRRRRKRTLSEGKEH